MWNKLKNLSKITLIRIGAGVVCFVLAVSLTLGFMLPSYAEWKSYYDAVIAEKEHQEYINSLKLEFLGITAELSEDMTYWDNDSAYPEAEDFVVKANFTEKGREFSRKLSAKDYTIEVPENFAKDGGTIRVTYVYEYGSIGKDEEGKPIYPDPATVTATADVAITLEEPDETVFKVVQEPTYSEGGTAENINGAQLPLPVLNDENYTYLEYASEGRVKFIHEDSGMVIRKSITDTISVDIGGVKKEFNNVNCHFYPELDGFSMKFVDDEFILMGEASKTITLGAINSTVATQSDFAFGEGNFVTGALTGYSVGAKDGAVVQCGAITANEIDFEAGSTMTVISSSNTITLKGNAKFYGTLIVKETNCNKNPTGIVGVVNDIVIDIARTSRVTIDGYYYALGVFASGVTDMTVKLPYDARAVDNHEKLENELCAYTVPKDGEAVRVFSVTNCKETTCRTNFSIKANTTNYQLVTAPTFTSTGLAHDAVEGDYTLPVLNDVDYIVSTENDTITYTHGYTGLKISFTIRGTALTLGSKVYTNVSIATINIDGLTVSYDEDTDTYTLDVAAGKTVALGGIKATSLVISGSGTLNNSGVIAANKLVIKSGVTVNNSSYIETYDMLTEAGSTLNVSCASDTIFVGRVGGAERTDAIAKLFGTVSLTDTTGQNKTAVWLNSGCSLELNADSRVTVHGYCFAIGKFSGGSDNGKLYLPEGAERKSDGYCIGENYLIKVDNTAQGNNYCNISTQTGQSD